MERKNGDGEEKMERGRKKEKRRKNGGGKNNKEMGNKNFAGEGKI